MADLLIRPAADAFLQVGVWVAVMLAGFGILQWRTADRVPRWLEEHRRLAPLVGALLGVTPGCGGAIIVMPLFGRGLVSFGTVVATLVATLGDSAFVLLAAAPGTALLVHGISLTVAIGAGYVVDAPGIAPGTQRVRSLPRAAPSTVGAAAAETGIAGRRIAYRFPSPGILGFSGLVAVGLVVSVLVVSRLVPGSALTVAGVDGYLVTGAIGGIVALGIFIASRSGTADDTLGSVLAKSRSLRAADPLRRPVPPGWRSASGAGRERHQPGRRRVVPAARDRRSVSGAGHHRHHDPRGGGRVRPRTGGSLT